ncbi:hypothetical protein PV705_34155, partial [Streptomyces scabiei]|nr:hypothetical protein [Streptomyces scabiei]
AQQPRLSQPRRIRDRTRSLTTTPTVSVKAEQAQADEPKVWSETVVARLAELREEVYDGWDPEGLAAALKPHGVSTIQVGRRVKGKVVNRRGIDRSHIVNAIAERDGKRDAG